MQHTPLIWVFLAGMLAILTPETPVVAGEDESAGSRTADVVREAFRAVHDGFSTDEVLVRDELNRAFLAKCRESLPDAEEFGLNWKLLALRKAGRLDVAASKSVSTRVDDCRHAAEIAARLIHDRHGVSIDRFLCDPRLRAEFDAAAEQAAPTVPAYRLRRAALSLRKTRRLRPELVVRVADWGKRVLVFPASEINKSPAKIPRGPGIYIFRDKTGYLYIGESFDLRRRLQTHLDESDRLSLAHYFQEEGIDDITVEMHAFDPDSNARSLPMRRAYESELIRSRQPRFNVAP